MKKLIFASVMIFGLVFASIPVTASEDAGDIKVTGAESLISYNAGSVLVMDARTGVILYETQGFARRYPASITKIMTALLVLEQVEDLSEPVIFSANAVTLPDYAGRFDMVEGESISVLEALYGIMLPSANDIARALAEHVSGSVPDFVAQMNRRAEELGAYETRFINPCGLPGNNQFTTAYDIALIMRAAVKNPLFVAIIGTPYFELPPTNLYPEQRLMRNSNVMVRPTHEGFNPRVIGGKTGFTNAAQHTLVSYASYDGREIIVSVLFASPRGAIFSDTSALMEFIFQNMPAPIIVEYVEEEPETVEAFSPGFTESYDPPVAELPDETETITLSLTQYISNTDAIAAASMSVAVAVLALVGLAIFRKRAESKSLH